ncbi:hypothetical protein Poly51_11510 [Rubripirellula tenax]|uniref:Uncharacterized protein n=1 Tax=Rubripirellula tenax TaxID=2528015 RepID=A0A5C6FLC5_9BACT|nr:BBP7 family outer membrane beta-barrel protein [Rubripirellula tenax]TWU60869.1 hypothetical protein Poly51_11510 [Rubripirellula tenax]
MDRTPNRFANSPRISLALACAAAIAIAGAPSASGQVRGKSPDRGVYQPPKLESVAVEEIPSRRDNGAEQTFATKEAESQQSEPPSALQTVGHEEVVLVAPHTNIIGSGAVHHDTPAFYEESSDFGDFPSPMHYDGGCDGNCGGGCDRGCDGGCGASGCDSMGCGGCSNGSICFSRDQWFGGIELRMMFRNGDRLPALITTGPSTDLATAGRLDQATTSILAGGDKEYTDASFGGLVTLGTWLDDSQCRSLVLRGWAASEDSFGFDSDQNRNSVLARPFNNSAVTPSEPSTIVVAFPTAASGSVHVAGSSNVYGGDISVRQFWYGNYGGTVDLLYGYQYMRMNEDLNVSSTSLSLDGSFGPAGSVISIGDSIDAINDFHGGQLGIASNYREGCWSFRTLTKVGFGSLRRTAKRSGSTVTQSGADVFNDPNGLLVRSTNAGTQTDHTFGWVPELDLSLGWHRFPHFDVTLGYHIIAMTDALRVSGALDPNLASNLSDPLVGGSNPSAGLSFDTFYVQGVHLGLQYVY